MVFDIGAVGFDNFWDICFLLAPGEAREYQKNVRRKSQAGICGYKGRVIRYA